MFFYNTYNAEFLLTMILLMIFTHIAKIPTYLGCKKIFTEALLPGVSSPVPLICGTPQGSVLGPSLLFLFSPLAPQLVVLL